MMSHQHTQECQQLQQLANNIPDLNALFDKDKNRANDFTINFDDLFFDYSKQLMTLEVKACLIELAEKKNLSSHIQRLFAGNKVNVTEGRAALHTALRLPVDNMLMVDDQNITEQVHASLKNVETLVNQLRQGLWRGYSGKAITDVVNIGVGGSDLGPLMTCTALSEWATSNGSISDIGTHFVSNMDGTQMDELLFKLNPETTVFIISSKSFSTSDTFSNADTALAWFQNHCDDESVIKRNHFIGISANPKKMDDWDIPSKHQLKLWDWVGGRFSMWSAIGLTIAVKIGMDSFYELLAGAHEMDQHFIQTDFEKNLPVMLGLIGVWNSSFLDINAHTVLPYDGRLKYFPNYLTQLEMESNGKSVDLAGAEIDYKTCPILWGDIGSNAQHAFYQLLHQGTQRVSCDFIACVERYERSQTIDSQLLKQHQLSLANCLAQSRVLAFGNEALVAQQSEDAYKQYHGNQPSTTLLLSELTPKTLGMLIALYEHKVFVMSVIWGINPFDQWGVELGKVMATELNEVLKCQQDTTAFDVSTNTLINKIKQQRLQRQQKTSTAQQTSANTEILL